jgi:uncharacterized protein YdhG (YjbR/CyaY superfamily)
MLANSSCEEAEFSALLAWAQCADRAPVGQGQTPSARTQQGAGALALCTWLPPYNAPMHPDVLAYIESAPPALQPALRDLRSLIVNAFSDAEETLYGGKFPVYNRGGEMVAGFAVRSKGIMLYTCNQAVVARYADKLGKLVDGKACVLFKETPQLGARELRHIVRELLRDAAAAGAK